MNTTSTHHLLGDAFGPCSRHSLPAASSDNGSITIAQYESLLQQVREHLAQMEYDPGLNVIDLEEMICVFRKELLDVKIAVRRGSPLCAQKEFVDMLGRGFVLFQFCMLNGLFLKSA